MIDLTQFGVTYRITEEQFTGDDRASMREVARKELEQYAAAKGLDITNAIALQLPENETRARILT